VKQSKAAAGSARNGAQPFRCPSKKELQPDEPKKGNVLYHPAIYCAGVLVDEFASVAHSFLKRAVVLVALVLAINGPQYLRNYEFGGLSLRDGRVHFMRYSPRPRCDLNPP
jgi:hypothetical protein